MTVDMAGEGTQRSGGIHPETGYTSNSRRGVAQPERAIPSKSLGDQRNAFKKRVGISVDLCLAETTLNEKWLQRFAGAISLFA